MSLCACVAVDGRLSVKWLWYLQSRDGFLRCRVQERLKLVDEIITRYNQTHTLPSRPDGNISVGYDYGFLLYNLALLGNPAAGEIYRKMFSVLDGVGVWVEYYENNKPMGTRYRPWESGINLEAAILYAEKFSK